MKQLIIAMSLFAGAAATTWANEACFKVEGMTCAACGITLKSAVNKVDGVQAVVASVEKKNAAVKYDSKKTNDTAIKAAIDNVGYKATIEACSKTKS